MTRTKQVDGVDVELTPEQDALRDAEELAVAAGSLDRAKIVMIEVINTLRDQKKSLPILSNGIEVDTGDMDAGVMATKIHASALSGKVISSITNSGGIATAITPKNHHLKNGTEITVSGADQPAYNITPVVTRTGPKSFTYSIVGTPVDATGSITFSPNTMRFIPTDNQVTFVDDAIYKEIYLDVEEYVDGCQVNARELKNSVVDATTVGEIDAIDITAGWPDTGV